MAYAAVNGLNMYYEVHGEGPPLLSLHGGAGSINPASTAIPFFETQFRVIAIEQMGHERTADVIDRPFHYHDMAEDTVELMRQLGIESASVLGYSDGGIIGLDMAIHHPERVTNLAVTGANSRTDGYTAEKLEWVRTFIPMTSRYPTPTPAYLPTVQTIGPSSSDVFSACGPWNQASHASNCIASKRPP